MVFTQLLRDIHHEVVQSVLIRAEPMSLDHYFDLYNQHSRFTKFKLIYYTVDWLIMDKSQQSEGQQQCPNEKFQTRKARWAEIDEKSINDKIKKNSSSIQRAKLSSNLKPFQSFIGVNDVKFIMSDGEAVGNSIILSSIGVAG